MASGSISLADVASKPILIYGLIDTRTGELRYVGKTAMSPSRRFQAHKRDAMTRKGRHVYHWFRECLDGNAAPEMIDLEQIDPGGDWAEAERFWIANARFLGCRLTNAAEGGAGPEGVKHSEETRAMWSRIAKGKKKSPEHCAAVARAKKGQKFTHQALANMLAGQQRRRERERALGIPGAPRPPQYQIERLIAGRRRRAAEQNASKQK